MKRTIKITLIALCLIVFAGLLGFAPGVPSPAGLQTVVKAATESVLILEGACDCRTGNAGFFSGTRGDPFIVSGKLFPAGTLPAGTGANDPTLPVKGIAPIGEWTCRGQSSTPFPPIIAPAYSSSPFAFNTQYFILNDGRALTVEGYALANGSGERLAITGGIGAFRGASGDVEEGPFGTNATGCPNFRARFTIEKQAP
jgi:hypothetical protein